MNNALGMIEVIGFSTAIEVADVMVKTASVHVEKIERARGNGQMTIFVTGDVGAVNAAVAAGKSEALAHDLLVASDIIARPATGIESLATKQQAAKPKEVAEPKVAVEAGVASAPKATTTAKKPVAKPATRRAKPAPKGPKNN